MADLKIDRGRYSVDSLYQWDINQELKIYGLSMLDPEIHFTNEAMGGSIVVDCTVDASGVISVNIPNSLLQYKYSIVVYIAGFEGDTFKTYHKVTIPVKARKRPGDYTLSLSDNEVYSFQAMNRRITDIENEIQKEGSILYSYSYDADDINLVEASGKKSIGEYIPLVSNSLKAIKGLSDKFKTMIDANTKLGETALSIAKGINSAKVFDTTADMEAWLSDEANKGKCDVGNNLYIVDVDVPDWWIAEVLDTADSETGFYYKIAQLEVQKVDLTDINNDIDTLQSDVKGLEGDIETLENKGIETLSWSIGDELYRKDELFLTLPEKASWIDSIELNGVLHVFIVVYGTSTQKHYKYENGEWTYICDLPSDIILQNTAKHSAFVVYRGEIYAGIYKQYSTSNYQIQLYKFNNNTMTWTLTTIGNLPGSSAYLLFKNIPCVYNDLLIVGVSYSVNSYTYASIFAFDGTTRTDLNITTSISGNNKVDTYFRDLEMSGDNLILALSDSHYIVDMTASSKSFVAISETSVGVHLKKIKDETYSITGTITRKIDKNTLWLLRYELLKNVYNLFEYENKILYFNVLNDNCTDICEIILYKIATSYAPKGTKIYLSDNSFAISDNLEKIDNGYLVTADGEIKIGIIE